MSRDYQSILDTIAQDIQPSLQTGEPCQTIPKLANIPCGFGISLVTNDGEEYWSALAGERFSIQSISKLFTLELALSRHGQIVWERVGREPSGDPFNSLILLEQENGVPRNPFVNAGALVVTDCLVEREVTPARTVLDYLRRLSGAPTLNYNNHVALSERANGHVNAAMAHFLKGKGNLVSEVDTVLDTYVQHCAIEMSCRDLARACSHLANSGICAVSGDQILTADLSRKLNALLLTCGLYDGVGDFAYRVGIPAKSGVGGGIVGIVPNHLSIAVWSPRLDHRGNSSAGTLALEKFARMTGLGIF